MGDKPGPRPFTQKDADRLVKRREDASKQIFMPKQRKAQPSRILANYQQPQAFAAANRPPGGLALPSLPASQPSGQQAQGIQAAANQQPQGIPAAANQQAAGSALPPFSASQPFRPLPPQIIQAAANQQPFGIQGGVYQQPQGIQAGGYQQPQGQASEAQQPQGLAPPPMSASQSNGQEGQGQGSGLDPAAPAFALPQAQGSSNSFAEIPTPEQLEADLKRAQIKLKEYDERYAQDYARIGELQQTVDDQKTALQEANAQVKNLEREKATLNSRAINVAEEHRVELKRQKNSLDSQLQHEKEANKNLVEEARTAKNAGERMRHLLQEEGNRLRAAHDVVADREAIIHAFHDGQIQMMHDKPQWIRDMEQKIIDLDAEKNEAQQACAQFQQAANEQVQMYQQQIAALQTQMGSFGPDATITQMQRLREQNGTPSDQSEDELMRRISEPSEPEGKNRRLAKTLYDACDSSDEDNDHGSDDEADNGDKTQTNIHTPAEAQTQTVIQDTVAAQSEVPVGQELSMSGMIAEQSIEPIEPRHPNYNTAKWHPDKFDKWDAKTKWKRYRTIHGSFSNLLKKSDDKDNALLNRKKEINKLLEHNRDHKKDKEKLRNQIKEDGEMYTAEIQRLQELEKQHTLEIEKLQQQIGDDRNKFNDEVEKLQSRENQQETENTQLRKQADDYREKYNAEVKKSQSLQNQHETENSKLRQQNDNDRNKHDREIADLQAQFDQAKQSAGQALQAKKDAEDELDKAQEQLRNASEDPDLRSKVDQAEQQAKDARSPRRNAVSSLNIANGKLKKTEQTLKSTEEDLKTTQSNLSKAERAKEKAEAEFKEAQEEINERNMIDEIAQEEQQKEDNKAKAVVIPPSTDATPKTQTKTRAPTYYEIWQLIPLWWLAPLFIMMALYAYLFNDVCRERQLWLDANEFTVQRVIDIQNSQDPFPGFFMGCLIWLESFVEPTVMLG